MKFLKLLRAIGDAIAGWIFIFPLNYLVPRSKNNIIFIGKGNGYFADNVKYFFLYIYRQRLPNLSVYYLSSDKKTITELEANRLPALKFPSLKAFKVLLRSGVIIADTNLWLHDLKYFLLYKAIKIQLWHGVGFKQLVAPALKLAGPFNLKKFFMHLYYRLRFTKEQRTRYDLFFSSSQFHNTHTFAKVVHSKEYLNFGQPRTDILVDPHIDNLTLIGADKTVITAAKELKQKTRKTILYAPTFRRFRNDLRDVWGDLSLEELNEFAVQNNATFILKFHPNTSLNDPLLIQTYDKIKHPHILVYDKDADIYPLMVQMDVLITDYSSIYMDYLLLDRPVIFYCFDYKKYVVEEGETQFDYNWITPGPKCHNFQELKVDLAKILNGCDEFKKKRAEIANLGFDYKDGKSSARIWNLINDKFIRDNS